MENLEFEHEPQRSTEHEYHHNTSGFCDRVYAGRKERQQEESTPFALTSWRDGVKVYEKETYYRELLLLDMKQQLRYNDFCRFTLEFPNLQQAAIRVATRYNLKNVEISSDRVTFSATAEEAFKYLWWVVGLTKGGYVLKSAEDDDDVILSALEGAGKKDCYLFMEVAILWLDKHEEDKVNLFRSPFALDLCSEYNEKQPFGLAVYNPDGWGTEFKLPQHFLAFANSISEVLLVRHWEKRLDMEKIAARLQEAMPQYRFWVTPRFRWLGVTTPIKYDMWTATFWALVLLNGEGSLEDGFGFPLSDRQKEAARKAFGTRIYHEQLIDHTFVVGRR